MTVSNPVGAVLLITHKRVTHLKKVVTSLETAWIDSYKNIHAIYHDGQVAVKEVLDSVQSINIEILKVNRENTSSPAEAISRNIFDGLSKAFSDNEIDFVTVIEDDIQVREDFFDFNAKIINLFLENQNFKGINGFSGANFDLEKDSHFGFFRYGFGWGWTIPKRTWNQIADTWQVNLNAHWDALIEDTIRTGFVVMPHNSRIQNIGFDNSATHTLSGGSLERKLNRSYCQTKRNHQISLEPSVFDLNWRNDSLKYKDTRTFIGFLIQQTADLIELISSRSRNKWILHYPSQKIRAILLRFCILLSR